MKTYKDLVVTFHDKHSKVEFLRRITNQLNHPDYIYMPNFTQNMMNSVIYQIVSRVIGTYQARIVIDSPNDENELSIINIIPYNTTVSQFSCDEYNRIIDYFYNAIILPIVSIVHCKVNISSGYISISMYIPASYNLLNNFVQNCDKKCPLSHPKDRNRWFDFLCCLVVNNEELAAEILQRWFIEEQYFDIEIAEELSLQYEYGIALLRHNRNRML